MIAARIKLARLLRIPADTSPTPTVTACSPSQGSVLGGAALTISGSGFKNVRGNVTRVAVGGTDATGLTVVDEDTLTCVSPVGSVGDAAVRVFGPGGQGVKTGIFAYSDPSSQSLTGWFRASFAGSPWGGTASAGTSGSNSASEATSPPAAGAALNGFIPADFDGTNDLLTLSGTGATYWTSTGLGGAILFNADTAASPDATTPYNEDLLIAISPNGVVGVSFSTSGVRFWALNPAFVYSSIAIAVGTGGWHLIQFRYDGINIQARLDSGSWQILTVLNTAWSGFPLSSQTLRLGNGVGALGGFFDGRIVEVLLRNDHPSDAAFEEIRSYVNSRYGLAL